MKTSLLFLISPPSLSKSFFRVPNSKLTSWNLGKVKEYNQWSLKPWKSKTCHGIILTKLFKFTQFPVLTGIWFEPTNSLICQQTLISSFRDFACSEQQVWAASEMWHWHTHNCLQVSVSSYKFWFNIFLFVNLVWILLSFWCSAWYDTNLTNHVALFLVCIWLFFISRF